MNILPKQLSIAVIGAPSSGKSYLLFDLIHAFHVLGYRPQELPLNYQYSSFGTFFYDTFNADTGGMKGTEVYAGRPESHYGARLTHPHGNSLWVNFLNIPGEAFRDLEAIENYFALKDKIERNPKGLFWLTTYRAPSGHEIQLVLPTHGFNLEGYGVEPIARHNRHIEYMQRWENIHALLKEGDYQETGGRKEIPGKYLFEHLSEILTDSVLLCLKEGWNMITGLPQDLTYYEENVFKHFYPLSYCQNATDLIICDNINARESAAQLSQEVSQYLNKLTGHAPNVYLAYRNADLLLADKVDVCKRALAAEGANDVTRRNKAYSAFMDELMAALAADDGGWLGTEKAERIVISAGKGHGFAFKGLLSLSLNRNKKPDITAVDDDKPLPPHVFFTATPIDSSLEIYQNDPSDVTRFILDNGSAIKSFVRETTLDMTRHGCWGSLQLLMDLLAQNDCLPSSLKNELTQTLNYNNSNQ